MREPDPVSPAMADNKCHAGRRSRNGIYTRCRALLNPTRPAENFTPTSKKKVKQPNRRKRMQRTTPPFRADHVGSLLRPAALKEARAKRERNEITADALRAIEDREIERAIRKQEEIGLKLATDGEFRRSWYQFDFLKGLDGVELYQVGEGIAFHGVKTKAESVRVIGRVGFSSHPHIDDFRFVREHTRVTPKMTIPAPNMLHFRPGRRSIIKEVYPDLEPFFEDVANASRKAVRAFYDAGCRYLQFDDTTWAMMCDERELAHSRERGDEPEKLPAAYARMINRALEGRPADMTVTLHSCRGNFRSAWIAEGGYEPFAERLFNEVYIDGYFLEYDSERAGGFEPLRFFPKGKKQLVLGLVTSKSGALEQKDDIKRRIEEATKYVALDQLCLSPQCGFASTEEGNVLSEDEQWAKLRMVVEVADEVWG